MFIQQSRETGKKEEEEEEETAFIRKQKQPQPMHDKEILGIISR
jgi:hypothetical protein